MDDIELVEIQGTVKVLTEGSVRTVEWVNYRNRAWLAPLWVPSHDGQWIRPVRLIAPKMASGYESSPGADMLQFFQQMSIPMVFLESAEPPDEDAPLLEIIELPETMARNPGAGH